MSKINNRVLNMSLDQVMSDRFSRYSKYIIQGRALPDVRDGLKPVQRRILFSMFELGLTHNKAFKKSARVVGDVIGKYHPHGDSSIYEAMVRMSQSWKMNSPLISMHGNNGSIDDDPAAAMRYTEARLAKIAFSMLDGIKKNTVFFAPNFDDSEKEPTVLPALTPNLLVNGAKGIAAGYATEMPPHNLGEIIEGIILKIKSPNVNLDTLMKVIKGPDFPTGGTVQGIKGIYEAFERGRGKIVIRSKFKINNSKTKPSISITEIPYGVIKAKLVREIDEIRFNKKISGIKNVSDQTDRTGLEVMIELIPGTNINAVINYLLVKTQMQIFYNYNNIAIKDAAPKQMGLIDLIDAYLIHQKKVQKDAITFDLNKDLKRFEIVKGLIKVASISREVIETIIKSSGSKLGVIINLVEKFAFTELQANAIAELKLYRLSKTDQSTYIEERNILNERIRVATELLHSPNKFNNYLIKLLKKLKTDFATPRKTTIELDVEKLIINSANLIKHEDTWVGISKYGYIKRFSNRVYEANILEEYTLKNDDSIIFIHKINTIDKLLVFTSFGKYIFLPVYQIPEVKFKSFGQHINDFATIGSNEKIVSVIAVNDFDLTIFLFLASTKGKIKKVLLKLFNVSRCSKPLIAMKLDDDDELINVTPTNGYQQIVLITKSGKAVKYLETQIPLYGIKSKGVKGISLVNSDVVVSMIPAHQNDIIGLVSNRGGIKRLRINQIQSMTRTTQGKSLFLFIKGKPHVVIDAAIITTNDQVMFKTFNDISFVKFSKIQITSKEEGFSSQIQKKLIDAKIMVFHRIYKQSSLINNLKKSSNFETNFKAAEKTISSVNTISIDDILKDL